MRVAVIPYDPTWPTAFWNIAATLKTSLAEVPLLSIEHVGSTSVPGLAAKPIIDIDIIVAHSAIASAIDALTRAGYIHLGECGIRDRHAFQAPPEPAGAENLGAGKGLRRNVYLCPEGALALRNHFAVRDMLRRDEGLRDEYARVKMELAEREFESIDKYVEGKSEVLKRILEKAGLGRAELEEIEKANEIDGPRS